MLLEKRDKTSGGKGSSASGFSSLSSPDIPPVEVVAGGWGMSTEDSPAPLVHQVAKGQEGNFL